MAQANPPFEGTEVSNETEHNCTPAPFLQSTRGKNAQMFKKDYPDLMDIALAHFFSIDSLHHPQPTNTSCSDYQSQSDLDLHIICNSRTAEGFRSQYLDIYGFLSFSHSQRRSG
jgi:hypothetical protein